MSSDNARARAESIVIEPVGNAEDDDQYRVTTLSTWRTKGAKP